MGRTVKERSESSVTPEVECNFFSGDTWQQERVAIPGEMPLSIFVNEQEVATVLCTPAKLTQLVIGFLYLEGIITGRQEVASLRVCEDEPIADIRLTKTEYKLPPRRTLTSGCGSGVSFKSREQKVDSNLVVTPEEVLSLMKQLHKQQALFQQFPYQD